MSFFRSILDVVTIQQDFLWFCVMLAWLAVGGLLWLHRRHGGLRERLPWLATVACGGFLLSSGELILHSLPAVPSNTERLGWDFYLNGAQTVQSLASLLFLGRCVRRTGLLLLGGALTLLWFWRFGHFQLVAALLLSAAVILAGLARGEPAWRRLVWILALAPIPATTGLCAELLGHPRRWVDLTVFALPSGTWQLLSAGFILRWVGREYGWRSIGARGTTLPPELRGFFRATLIWLTLGLGLAAWTGRLARVSFEESLLSRARAAAALVSPSDVLRLVSSSLTLEHFDEVALPSGRTNRIVHVPYVVEAGRPVRHALARIGRLNPDISWARFLTLRDGLLIAPAQSDDLPAKKDVVVVDGAATPADHAAWTAAQSFFEKPFITDYGEMVRARAPVVAPGGQMLGWVALETGSASWAAAQAVARLQTFALVALGVTLALFVTLQRLGQLERLRAEQAAAAAREADRVKTAFLAKVSHELRTPIQSILGYGELLAGQPLGAESRRWLNSVRGQGQLLIRLVNDLLDLAALQSGAFRTSPQPGSLAELVRSTSDSLLPRAVAKNLRLIAEIESGVPPWLTFDGERVRQVLLNLIGNAIKFTDSGEIRVRLQTEPNADGSVWTARLAIKDTGPGIAAEDMPRLFRPFSRLHDHDGLEGAGLGLALSAAICQSMAGSCHAESDGRNGTTFVVRLPLPLAGPPAPPAQSAAPVELAGRRVLVADDNPLVRELFVTSLRQAGAWVDQASDGLEAVELCSRHHYAVVVLDVSMPWLNGMEAARRIRGVGQTGLRIIGVSAHAGTADRSLALAAGMDLMLVKPLATADLLDAVAGKPVAERTSPQVGSPDNLALLRRLRRQFVVEAPRLLGELEQAHAASDRYWLRARAHYLRNSADVAGFPEISLLCASLEKSAQDLSADPGPDVTDLRRLLRQIHLALSPDTSPGINHTSNPS